ncbi:hypothetical protein INR49_005099 [Caranx melampygus]|nr:hypothetical protein INR49_005099 [Caranx melampygus]
MTRDVLLPLLLFLSVLGSSHGCLQDPVSAYRFTGAVCRLTYPAAVVLNEKTTKVIEAAFQHAKYPSMKGEKSLLFIGQVTYGLDNLEIHNLTIGRSAFELREGEGIAMEISNVSATFRGTIQYGYGSWLVNVAHSIDFEIDSQIDLGINPKLYCGQGKVAADTSDCYLNFHKLQLQLQGDKEPNWLKKLFTDFITFTVKLVIKGQICKEINKVANILADFIQDTAGDFVSDGDISGMTRYNNTSTVIQDSVFHPTQLTEHRMLYFWLSDQVLQPMVTAAHQDGRFQLNISGAETTELFQTKLSSPMPEYIKKCLSEPGSPQLRVWSSSVPLLNTSSLGTSVWVQASGQLTCGSEATPVLFFHSDVALNILASYADKKLFLHGNMTEVSIVNAELTSLSQQVIDQAELEFIREAVVKIGIPKVLRVLQTELTRLLDKQGTNLFDLYNPEFLFAAKGVTQCKLQAAMDCGAYFKHPSHVLRHVSQEESG